MTLWTWMRKWEQSLSWIFLSSRIGFVLTVSATWQIARSFGKQHQRVGFIYTNTEPQIQENMKTGLAYAEDTRMQNIKSQIINGIKDTQRQARYHIYGRNGITDIQREARYAVTSQRQ